MRIWVHCNLQVEFRCYRCGEGYSTPLGEVWPGGEIPFPSLPVNWNNVNGNPVCPKHSVLIQNVEPGRPGAFEKKRAAVARLEGGAIGG